MLLGCLLNNPSLCFRPDTPLSKTDFAPQEFHKVLFVCIQALAQSGVTDISEIEIDNFVSKYEAQQEILQDSNYYEFISTVKELAVLDNFDYYYNVVRKFSLLRDLKSNGHDISDYYDEAEDEDKAQRQLEKWTIKDILDDIDNEASLFRNKYDINFVRSEMTAGEDTEGLIAEFEQAPAFGSFLTSPYLTQLYMGLCRGHLIMNSSPAGTGKTRMMIADLCNISIDTLWNEEAHDFVTNPNYDGAGLFIHSELASRKEINPMFLACVSGVDVKHITMGTLTKEEKPRVVKAGEILQRNNMILCDMPDFTSANIKRKIEECIKNYGTTTIGFDYLQLQSAISAEYKASTSIPAREDLVLRALATDLKAYAEQFNVAIMTASQLNGNEKQMEFPDESCLSSSKAIKQKLDAAGITLSVKDRPKEYKKIEPYLKRKGFDRTKDPMPNMITYVYKARFGEYADQKLKVWRYFDSSTFRNKDFFVTDQYDQIVNIPKPVLEGDF